MRDKKFRGPPGPNFWFAALRASLTSSFTPFGRSGRETHVTMRSLDSDVVIFFPTKKNVYKSKQICRQIQKNCRQIQKKFVKKFKKFCQQIQNICRQIQNFCQQIQKILSTNPKKLSTIPKKKLLTNPENVVDKYKKNCRQFHKILLTIF